MNEETIFATALEKKTAGERLAFLSDHAKEGQLQVYVASAAHDEAKRLTTLTGFLADPHWSPDGKHLGFLFTENAPRAAGPVQPGTAETGVLGSWYA